MKKFISVFLAVGLLASILPPVSYAYDSYYAYLTDSSYTGSDAYVNGSFEFPEGIASIVVIDYYNACGDMTTDYNDPLGFEVYYSDQSPQPFYIPINSSEDCYYNSNYSCLGGDGPYPYDGTYKMALTVYEWSESEQMYEQTPVYSTELSFQYDGAGGTSALSCGGEPEPVCGDAICSLEETCSADNCCNGISTNTDTDPYNCGLCGTVCGSDEDCKLGICTKKKLSYYEAKEEAVCDSEDCKKAQKCIVELDPYTGCLMEFADVIPLIDKPVALALLADDICALKERAVEQADPIGVAVKSVLMVVDVADNIPDTVSFAGYVISVPVDIVEGIIDCLEGLIYDYLKDCGGYTWCLVNLGKAVATEAISLGKSIGNLAFSIVHSPVSVGVVNDNGQELGYKDGVFVWEFGDVKAVMVVNPEKITGGYNVALEGTGSGTYELDTVVMDTSGEVVKELKAENVPVSEGQNDYYKVEIPYDLNPDDISMDETEITPLVNFSDLGSDHWAYEYVADLVADGAIGGYEDGTFRPNKSISRAELLKISVEAFGLEQQVYGFGFGDVSEFDWFAGYVASGTYYNFVGGYPDGSFKPSKSISRAEALKIILGAAEAHTIASGVAMDEEAVAADYGVSLIDSSVIFTDIPSDAWYKNGASVAVTYGFVGGYSDNTFKPDKEITRAEASKIIYFVKEFIKKYVR